MAARRWRHLQLARPWLPLLVSCASGTCCSSVVLQDPEGSSGLSSPPSRPTCIHPLLQDPEGTLRGPISTPGVEDPGGSGAFLLSLLQRPWFFDNQSTRTQSLIINMYGTVPTCFFNCIIQFLTDSGLYCPPCFFFLVLPQPSIPSVFRFRICSVLRRGLHCLSGKLELLFGSMCQVPFQDLNPASGLVKFETNRMCKM